MGICPYNPLTWKLCSCFAICRNLVLSSTSEWVKFDFTARSFVSRRIDKGWANGWVVSLSKTPLHSQLRPKGTAIGARTGICAHTARAVTLVVSSDNLLHTTSTSWIVRESNDYDRTNKWMVVSVKKVQCTWLNQDYTTSWQRNFV